MLAQTVDHFLNHVLPAAVDYHAAEDALSTAFDAAGKDAAACEPAQLAAKRRAAEVAIAIDGLADRAATALGLTPDAVRTAVSALARVDNYHRALAVERICAIANAYKHDGPLKPKHPIASFSDVLTTGVSYGRDAYNIGKYSGIETFTRDRATGDERKVLGDVPWAIAGWINFFIQHGVALPEAAYTVCGVAVPAR